MYCASTNESDDKTKNMEHLHRLRQLHLEAACYECRRLGEQQTGLRHAVPREYAAGSVSS